MGTLCTAGGDNGFSWKHSTRKAPLPRICPDVKAGSGQICAHRVHSAFTHSCQEVGGTQVSCVEKANASACTMD